MHRASTQAVDGMHAHSLRRFALYGRGHAPLYRGIGWMVLGMVSLCLLTSLHLLLTVDMVYGLERYTVGGKGRRWEDEAATTVPETWPDGRGVRPGTILLDVEVFSEKAIAPLFLTPDLNIALAYEERGGTEWNRPMARERSFDRVFDADSTTYYLYAASGMYRDFRPTIDLGALFPINRIVFYTSPDRKGQYVDWFILAYNSDDPAVLWDLQYLDQDPLKLTGGPWTEAMVNKENKDWRVDVRFPLAQARYVSILPEPRRSSRDIAYLAPGEAIKPWETKIWEIAEMEIYGEGYVSKATYISKVIDTVEAFPDVQGEVASWGHIRWKGSRDPNAEVLIRTRTGDDEDPNRYGRHTGQGDEISYIRPDGRPLTYADYLQLGPEQKGPITPDTEHWSFWSTPYDFEAGLGGTPIVSPGPRRYIQFRVDFHSTRTDGARMDELSFDLSKPPAAQALIGEIWPVDVAPGEVTTFHYAMRPTLTSEDAGFDGLELSTPVQADTLRSVTIDGVPLDPATYSAEIEADRIRCSLPRFDAGQTRKLIEIVFDCAVVRYGTEFTGRVSLSSRPEEVAQLVLPGDATATYDGNILSVRTSLTNRLLTAPQVYPAAFTPNEDGVHDQTTISYAVLNLTKSTITAHIYSLSGEQIRRLYDQQGASGRYALTWDGRDEEGERVPPGVYLYRIVVQADKGEECRTGTVSVIY